MHKLDLTIARLKLLLAEIDGKRAALRATRHQYQEQIARLVNFAVHDDGGVDRTVTMLMDVDARLHDLTRQDHYLSQIHASAQRELDSLQLTKLIEEARAQLAVLRQQLDGSASVQDPGAKQAGPDRIAQEIHRLEEIIAAASGAAAKSISERV